MEDGIEGGGRPATSARRRRTLRPGQVLPWVVVPALGAAWHAHNLRGTWWFFDDWSVFDRVVHVPALQGMAAGFNGHLWVLQYLVYRFQVTQLGIGSHAFVAGVYVLVLLGLQLATAAVLRAGRVPSLVSLLVAALATYLGVGAQNMLFAVQLAPMLAMGLCVGAAALVLRRSPTRRTMLVVGLALLVSLGADSGYALSGVVLAAVVVVRTWPGRPSLVVAPALASLAAWFAFADLGPSWPGTVTARIRFVAELTLRTTGGLVGRAAVAGGVLLVLAAVLVLAGLRAGLVTGPARTLLYAGGASTAITVVALAQSRAGLVGDDFASSNRYLQSVAVPLVMGLVPPCAATLRGLAAPVLAQARPTWRGAVAHALAPLLVVLAFMGGLAPLRQYRAGFVGANAAVRLAARSAAIVVQGGCPFPLVLDPASQPAGSLSPQLSTALVVDLVHRGALVAADDETADPAVVDRMCRVP